MKFQSIRTILTSSAAIAALSVPTLGQAQPRDFDVPAQPAVKAIPEFARQAGIQIIAPANPLRGIRSSPVKARVEVAVALNSMLKGTNLRIVSNDGPTIAFAVAPHPAAKPASLSSNAEAPPPVQHRQAQESASDSQDIVVTAQRREERLGDVPLSITAATGTQLTKLGVNSPADLEKIALGFTYRESAYGSPILQIRGIGFYEEAIALAPTVSVYTDQVPVPYSAMTQGVGLDIERVEVLKGPQGTLFGQNSTGGAINYIAAKPTDHFAAGLDASYGRFGSTQLSGFLSGPLTGTLKARLSAKIDRRGDWQKTYTSLDNNGFAVLDSSHSRTLGQRNFATGRLLLDWQPNDAISFELNLNGWRDRSDTQASQYQSFAIRQPGGTFPGIAALQSYPVAPRDNRLAGWDQGVDYKRNDDFYQVALRGNIILSDEVTLTSITDYTHLKTFRPSDQDGTEIFNLLIENSGKVHSFSQELRLSGISQGDRLKWMLGGNYLHDNSSAKQNIIFDGSNTAVGPIRFNNAAFVVYSQPVEGESVFASADYKLSEAVSAYGSARYSWQTRSFSGCTTSGDNGSFGPAVQLLSELLSGSPTGPFAPGECITLGPDFKPTGVLKSRFKEHNLSWRVGVDWKPTRNLLVYANATKGYKAGNYSNIALIFSGPLLPARQESVLAYETGFKATINRVLQVTGAAFYLDYKGKQIAGQITDPLFGPLQTIVNVPKSRVEGGEFEVNLRPLRGLELRAGGTYVNSRITSDFLGPDPKGVVLNRRGESFPGTPKWAALGDAEYEFPVSGQWSGFVGGGVNYRSKSRSYVGNNPLFAVPAYTLVDLRAGFRSEDGRYSVQLWGRNVFNKYYYTLANSAQDSVVRLAGMPATYGITISSRF